MIKSSLNTSKHLYSIAMIFIIKMFDATVVLRLRTPNKHYISVPSLDRQLDRCPKCHQCNMPIPDAYLQGKAHAS